MTQQAHRTIDRRQFTRITPENLHVDISITPPSGAPPLRLSGKVIDISYRGIKIYLDQAPDADIDQSLIKITLLLPRTGIPVTISGKLCHCQQKTQLGVQFADTVKEHYLDELLFECVKS